MITTRPQFQQRPYIPQNTNYLKKPAYVNKMTDETIIKNFFGKIYSGNLGDIKEFLDRNTMSISNIRDEIGNSPLHIILNMDNTKITSIERLQTCKYLVLKGANVNAYNKQDVTPIHLASKLQHDEILDLFLEYGGNVNILDVNQQNALHHALIPQLAYCPTFSPSKMIPEPEMKFRDINKISQALWQQLNDFFNVKNLAKLQNNPPLVPKEKENPLLYPLLAIKNIIHNSNTYLDIKANKSLIPTENTFLENKKKDININLQKIASRLDISDKDRQFKTREYITSTKNSIISELKDYFKGATENIKFGKDNAFETEDQLKYFETDPMKEVIFASEETNYKKFLDDILLKLDDAYDKEIKTITEELNDFIELIESFNDAIGNLHYINMYIDGKDNVVFGNHQQLNDNNIKEYNEKYQLNILKKNDKYINIKEKVSDSNYNTGNDFIMYEINNFTIILPYNEDDYLNIEETSKIEISIKYINDNIINLTFKNLDTNDINDTKTVLLDTYNVNTYYSSTELDETRLAIIKNKIPIKKIKYANTSVIYTFLNRFYQLMYNQLKVYIFNFNMSRDLKYDYYYIYNLISIINSNIDEFKSYLLFILENDKPSGLDFTYYQTLEFYIDNDYLKKIEQYFTIINKIKSDLTKFNLTNSFNKIVNILNFHQNLIINYTLIRKLYTEYPRQIPTIFPYTYVYYNRNNYKITNDDIIKTLKELKNKFVGIFNKSLPQLPNINVKNATKIDQLFFEQSRPIIYNLIFYRNTNISIKSTNYFIISSKDENATTNFSFPIGSRNGRLLFLPEYNDINNTNKDGYIIDNLNNITGSLLQKKITFNSTNTERYDNNLAGIDPKDNIGIIGVDDIKTSTTFFDLLDETKLPYDLPNTYFNVTKKNDSLPYVEIITTLKRIFISMVLDSRKQDIYQESIKIPSPKLPAIKPEKRPGILFGYNDTSPKSKIPKNLFDYIIELLKTQLDNTYEDTALGKTNPALIVLANRLIAEGIDTILQKNIENYYNVEASNLLKGLTSDQPKTIIDFPTLPDISFGINFNDLNDTFYELISNQIYGSQDIINVDLLLMEDGYNDINVLDYNYENPKEKNSISKQIYYKQEYLKNDESIVKKRGLQCLMNNPNIIKTLAKYGISINHQDIFGKTPLFYAIESRNYDLVNTLLNNSPNLFIRNLQNTNTIKFLLIQETEHQKILTNNNEFTYAENYKQNMLNLFETTDDLKKNMPKNIEIINYLPIYLLNQLWYSLFKDDNKKELDKLFFELNTTLDKKRHSSIDKQGSYLFSDYNMKDKFNTIIKEVNSGKKFGLEEIIDKLEKKKTQYTDIQDKLDSHMDQWTKINDLIKSLDKKINKLKTNNKNKSNQLYDAFNITPSLNPFIKRLAAENVISLLDNIEKPDEIIEYKHFILGLIIKEYHKNDVINRGENIHLYISTIYSKIIKNMMDYIQEDNLKKKSKQRVNEELGEYIKQIGTIEKNLEVLCTYLDQRYMENNNIDDNLVIKDITDSISYTCIIAIQNNFLLSIKKLLIYHILRNYGIDSLNKCEAILKLLVDDTKVLFGTTLNNSKSISNEYVKMSMEVKEDEENIEYIGFDQIISEVRQILITNKVMPINENSQTIQNYDNYIVPYYKSLYKTMVDHQKKLILNYIKFIINQYNGIKILKKVLENIYRLDL